MRSLPFDDSEMPASLAKLQQAGVHACAQAIVFMQVMGAANAHKAFCIIKRMLCKNQARHGQHPNLHKPVQTSRCVCVHARIALPLQGMIAVGAGGLAVNAVKGILGGSGDGYDSHAQHGKHDQQKSSKGSDDDISKALESLRKSGTRLLHRVEHLTNVVGIPAMLISNASEPPPLHCPAYQCCEHCEHADFPCLLKSHHWIPQLTNMLILDAVKVSSLTCPGDQWCERDAQR